MRSLIEIEVEIIVGKNRAANWRNANGAVLDFEFIDNFGNQAVNYPVIAAGTVVERLLAHAPWSGKYLFHLSWLLSVGSDYFVDFVEDFEIRRDGAAGSAKEIYRLLAIHCEFDVFNHLPARHFDNQKIAGRLLKSFKNL
jgi:hypothetical protein